MSVIAPRALGSVGNIILLFVISNVHGEEATSYVSVALASAIGISVFARFGFDVLGLKELPARVAQRQFPFIKQFISRYLGRSLVFLTGLLFLRYAFGRADFSLDFLSIAAISLTITFTAFIGILLKANLRPGLAIMGEPGVALVVSTVIVVLTSSYASYLSPTHLQRLIGLGIIAHAFIFLCWAYPKIKEVFCVSGEKISKETLRRFDVESLSFFLISLTGYFYAHGFIWLSAQFLPVNEIAYLSIVGKLVFGVNFALMVSNAMYNPRFSLAIAESNMTLLQTLGRRSLRLMLTLATPVFLVFVFFAEEILSLFAVSSREAALGLLILSVGQMVNVITGNAAAMMNLSGHHVAVRNNGVAHLVLAMCLVSILGREFGLIGVVLGYASAIASQNIVLARYVKRRLGINIYKW
jgi:O-antigen/teichoic acid export membrane protein